MDEHAVQIWFFWGLLALPGYVLVQWFEAKIGNDEDRGGLLGTLGLSYLGSLVLLSPISIICYSLRLPLWVFSGVIVAAVVGSVVILVRRQWWKRAGKLVFAAFSVELIILLVDLIIGGRVGAFIDGGDFRVHLARIRWIVDHGFGNVDPFIRGDFFFPAYHTNILHGLYASCVQLTGADGLGVHYSSLPWAKLLAACGAYSLGWAVFRKRWVAWVVTVFAIGTHGTILYVVYPNKIAALWLVPTMMAFLIDGIAGECRWKTPVLLAAVALVLSQVHGLFAGFVIVLVGPVIAVVALHRIIRKTPDRWRFLACGLAFVVIAPFLLVGQGSLEQRGELGSHRARKKDERFAQFENGWRVRKLGRSGAIKYSLLAAAAVAVLLTSRRKHAAPLVGAAAVGASILFIPPLCTAALSALGKTWILDRLSFVSTMTFVVLGPGVVAFLLQERLKPEWAKPMVSVVMLLLAIPYAGRSAEESWSPYLSAAVDPTARHALLAALRDMDEFLNKIPAGETVLVDDKFGPELCMLHDVTVASNSTTSQGVPNMRQRRVDVRLMIENGTPWEKRRELLRRYQIRYLLASPSTPKAWLAPERVKSYQRGRSYDIIELNVD